MTRRVNSLNATAERLPRSGLARWAVVWMILAVTYGAGTAVTQWLLAGIVRWKTANLVELAILPAAETALLAVATFAASYRKR
jgi:hypothetical protein